MDSVKNVMSDCGNVSFNWVHRKANQLVHVLAKWSLSPSFFGYFDVGFGPLSSVNVILAEPSQTIVNDVVQ